MSGFIVTSVVTANVRGRASPGQRERHAGHHLVGASGQRPQHPPRIAAVARLAENPAVEHDDGVEAQHERVAAEPLRPRRLGLLGGERLGECRRDRSASGVSRSSGVSTAVAENGMPSHASRRRRRGDCDASSKARLG